MANYAGGEDGEKIGAGGMREGSYLHGEDSVREVAVAVLCPGVLSGESSCRRAYEEALGISQLNQVNVTTIHYFAAQQTGFGRHFRFRGRSGARRTAGHVSALQLRRSE